MPTFDLICLANSYKHGGRCVAGLRTDGPGWVRPVSARPDGSLNTNDYVLSDLTEVGLLDQFCVGVASARPESHHPENWVIDGSRWRLLARPMDEQLASVLKAAIVAGPELLRGHSDRVSHAHIQRQPLTASLALVMPEAVELYRHTGSSGKPSVRGRFSIGANGRAVDYDLSATDPAWITQVMNRGPQLLEQTDARFVMTISISEPFNHDCYKLIAAVIPLPASLATKL
jgi:hypothetical protein